MRGSLFNLHRRLFGIVIVGALTFGLTQAFAAPAAAESAGSCQRTGYAYIPMDCPECNGAGGWCDGWNEDCICFDW
jgi:hypothetical protein